MTVHMERKCSDAQDFKNSCKAKISYQYLREDYQSW